MISGTSGFAIFAPSGPLGDSGDKLLAPPKIQSGGAFFICNED